VQAGSAEIGVTNPEVVMRAREQGGSLVAFETLRRSNGNSVAVLPDSPIKSLSDLKGKTIGGVSWGGGGALYLTKVLGDMKIGLGDYSRVVTGNGAAAAAALRGKRVDALVLWDSAYAALENIGLQMRYIPITDQEKLGSNSLITTDAYLKDHADVLGKFCHAVTKSYYFARISPEAAVKIFLQVNPGVRAPSVPLEKATHDFLNIFKAYLGGATAGLPLEAKIGTIEPATWAFNQAYYKGTGLLKGLQPPDKSYTNRFIDHCNDFDRGKIAAAARGYK
jgi:NitT/TauT family transport system substrate-binding protein